MAKKLHKQRIFDGYYHAVTGRSISKDIRTKPDIKTGQRESGVLKDCMSWLKRNRIMANRNNTGFGDLRGTGQSYHYGIKSGGDVICQINGRYCEIECKHGNGGIWKINQQERARKVIEAGGLYFVVHSVQELEKYITPHLQQQELFL